jgi:hypothetical protein
MHLLKVMLKASGKKGVPQGGVITPPTIWQNCRSSPALSLRARPFGHDTVTDSPARR